MTFFLRFIEWAKDDTKRRCYNITKAFERVEEYATWMDERSEDLAGMTNESIQPAWNAWNMQTSRDNKGRVVWWMDLSSVDKLQELTANESLRLFVWFAHYLLFRHQTQQHGVVVVLNMARVDLRTFLSMLPPNMERKIEKLTMGVLPIKTSQIYVTASPKWSKVFMTVAKPFLSQQMRERIVVLKSAKELDDSLGADCVPDGFGKSMKRRVRVRSTRFRRAQRSADDELIGSTVTTKKLGFNDGESSVDSRTSGSNETSSIDHIECIEVRDEVDEYLDSSNPDQLGEQRAL